MTQTCLSKQLYEALVDAYSHLDYCGFGDSWERECADAQGLENKIISAIQEYEKSTANVPDTDREPLGL